MKAQTPYCWAHFFFHSTFIINHMVTVFSKRKCLKLFLRWEIIYNSAYVIAKICIPFPVLCIHHDSIHISFFLFSFLSFFLSFSLPSFLSFFLSLFLSIFLPSFLSYVLSYFLSYFLSFCLSFSLSFSLSFFCSSLEDDVLCQLEKKYKAYHTSYCAAIGLLNYEYLQVSEFNTK